MMKTLHLLAVLTAALLCGARVPASATLPGNVDPSLGGASEVDGAIFSIAVAGDGKVLIGGAFRTVRGVPRGRIARLHSDGTVDLSFNPGTGASDWVTSVAVQGDGKVVIGGYFAQVNGRNQMRVARLNADGSRDTTFSFGGGSAIGPTGPVLTLALQGDGKVLIGGDFNSVNRIARSYLARLNADGRLDTSFFSDQRMDGYVHSLAVQGDGKVLIAGRFITVNFTARNRIARLHPDGKLDTTFNPGSGADEEVSSLALQGDGKVLIGGKFSRVNGVTRMRIARLNADGTLDGSFTPPVIFGFVNAVAAQPDGKVLIGGTFTSVGGVVRNRIARLNADGSLDGGFAAGAGADGEVSALLAQTDGQVLVGGYMTMFDAMRRQSMVRLRADGGVDPGFHAAVAPDAPPSAIACQDDGRIVIGGPFTRVDDARRGGIARLHADGRLDAGFDPGSGLGGGRSDLGRGAYAVAPQPDGKVAIGGNFTDVNGVPRGHVARLQADGSVDQDFAAAAAGANDVVWAVAPQPDGKLVIGGDFTMVHEVPRRGVARLHADGSLDAGFDPGTGADGRVRCLALQADGKVLAGGEFTTVNGTPRMRVARLHADGSLDSGFDPGLGMNGTVRCLTWQADGAVLAGGEFSTVNGTPRMRVARLHADGRLDAAFDADLRSTSSVSALAVAENGRVFIAGGTFHDGNASLRRGIARLGRDGRVDRSFDPAAGVSSPTHPASVSSLAVQADGKVVIGGEFVRVDATGRTRIARLHAGEVVPASVRFAEAVRDAGLVGAHATAEAVPFGDGVPNLLKHAFNMNLAGQDSRIMASRGTEGLPAIASVTDSAGRILHFEFVRRRYSTLVYLPQTSTDPGDPASWVPLTGSSWAETIDGTWERVTCRVPADPVAAPRFFGRVLVRLP